MSLLTKKLLPRFAQPFLKLMLGTARLLQARRHPTADFVPRAPNSKTRVLFYDMRGLSYAGTQKSLQILAKHLNKNEFEVFFMYSSRFGAERRAYLANTGVELIDFNFTEAGKNFPYIIQNMQPHIFDVLKEKNIDILVAAGSGYPEFPVANITKLPIVYLQVFGSINPQKNIKKIFCISDYLKNIIKPSLPHSDIGVLPIQSEQPPQEAESQGRRLRQSLGIPDSDFVFGRIGRPDDNIFDPIGILAFEQEVKKNSQAHYLIMAPPNVSRELVRERKIPNVHFLPPSGEELKIWAFHYALDAMAHFRKDGETQGSNICESMLCGKPIISHKSEVWNGHLDFLDDSFSRVAEVGRVDQYTAFMQLFIALKRQNKLKGLGDAAQKKAEPLFLIKNNIKRFEACLTKILKSA